MKKLTVAVDVQVQLFVFVCSYMWIPKHINVFVMTWKAGEFCRKQHLQCATGWAAVTASDQISESMAACMQIFVNDTSIVITLCCCSSVSLCCAFTLCVLWWGLSQVCALTLGVVVVFDNGVLIMFSVHFFLIRWYSCSHLFAWKCGFIEAVLEIQAQSDDHNLFSDFKKYVHYQSVKNFLSLFCSSRRHLLNVKNS